MNIQTGDFGSDPSRDDARAALDLLRDWAARATPEEVAELDPAVARLLPDREVSNYPTLDRAYPSDFVVDEVYRAGLPDLQNGPASLIRGARTPIQHVGLSNFRMPLQIAAAGGSVAVEASVTGTVSLAADRKGINMSRILRTFQRHADGVFGFDTLDAALDEVRAALDSGAARLQVRFAYPLKIRSLRSGLDGWQYYETAFEAIVTERQRLRVLHMDYAYSSTCPCSLELSEHARQSRGQLATPHSQRSVARISAVLDPKAEAFGVEDLVAICRTAVPTETQSVVKREDEQAFAELNAANPIFVEDAARSFVSGLRADARIGDFRVVASHQESLHSHDAVSLLTEGDTFAAHSIDPGLFATLMHRG